MPDTLPTTDDFFSAPTQSTTSPSSAPGKVPTTDEFFSQQRPLSEGASGWAAPNISNGEAWKNILSDTPVGRIISAFGKPLTEPEISDDSADWLRKVGIYNDVHAKMSENTDGFAQGILRPLVYGVRAANEVVVIPALAAVPSVAMGLAEGSLAGVQRAGVEAQQTALGKAVGAEKLATDVAGELERKFTTGELGEAAPVHAPQITELPAEAARAHPDAAAVVGWAAQQERSILAEAAPIPERTITNDAGEATTVPATQGRLLTGPEMDELKFLRANAHNPEAVLKAYPGLADHLGIVTPDLPPNVARARSSAVIGEGEEGYFGTSEPTEDALTARARAAGDLPRQPAEESAPADIHAVAAQIEPKVTEYRDLEGRRDTFSRWMQELQEPTAANIEAKPPQALQDIDAEIAGVEKKVANAGARSQDRYSADLDNLHNKRAELLQDLVNNDAGMARVRRDYQDADAKMRDMAPAVSAAYREADARTRTEGLQEPETGPEAFVVPQEPVSTERGPDTAPAPAVAEPPPTQGNNSTVTVSRETHNGMVSTPEMISGIAQDVTAKLIAAGRPEDEARLGGQLAAARVAARAEQMGGKLGSAREIYDREGPLIAAATQSAPRAKRAVPEFASSKGGSITWARGSLRPLIKLFTGNADASTFIHESSHQWLEELLRDADHPYAPESLKADARTVREYLKADTTGPIKRAGHEKFARTGERYLMEGHAPTRALAHVFARFKTWLTQIYQTVTNLRAPITDDVRAVFDRLLSTSPERAVIAPELPFETGLGDRHEALAESATREKIPHLARKIRRERAEDIVTNHPELAHELAPGSEGTGGGAPPREGANGGEHAPESEPGETGGVQAVREVRARGGQFKDEGARPRPEGARESKLYLKVPKEPERLTEFVKRMGGVVDEGQEIEGRLPSGRRGKGLIKADGHTLERMAESAHDAGYFPELGGRIPDPHEFAEKLGEDLRGVAQHSDHDTDALAAYHDALGHNHEVDRIANDLAIDTHTMTRTQFWDKVAERLSEEQAAKEVESRMAAADTAAVEHDKILEEHNEHPEALEPEEITAAHETGRVGDLERPGNAGRGESAGEDHAGQSGRGGRPAGGAGPEGGAIPGEPTGPTGIQRADAAGIGKAGLNPDAPWKTTTEGRDVVGNVRLENLATTRDVDDLIRAQMENRPDLQDARHNQESYAHEARVQAAQALLCDVGASTRAAAAKFAQSGNEADAVALEQWRERLRMVFDYGQTLRASYGRALAAFRKMKGADEIKAQLAGRTLFQMQQEARLNATLDTPNQLARAAQRDAMTPIARAYDSFRNGIIWYYVNNLISGPITHAAYAMSSIMTGLARVGLETPAAAGYGRIQEFIAGHPIDRVHLSDAKAQLLGLAKGLRDGFTAGIRATRAGVPGMMPGEVLQPELPWGATTRGELPIKGIVGRIINTPSDVVTGIHTFGRTMHYEIEKARLIYVQAREEGLAEGSNAFNRRVAFLDANTPVEIMQGAAEHSTHMMMMDRAAWGSATQRISAISNNWLPAKIVLPFVSLPMQLLEGGLIERTPLALFERNVRDNLAGKNGGVARDMQAGKIAAGVGVAVGTLMLYMDGRITGSEPHNPNEAALWRMSGKQAYSVHLPFTDHWIPYRKWMGWYGPLVSMSADIGAAGHALTHEGADAAAKALVFGFGEVVADESWARGISDFVEAIKSTDSKKGEQYFKNLASNFVPLSVGQSQIAHLIDPYMRKANDFLLQVQSKTPFASESLQVKRDIFGEPLASHMIVTPTKINNDPAIKAMQDVGVWPRQVDPKIRGVELTPQQYDDYARIAGRKFKMSMDTIVNRPGFEQIPAHVRRKMIQDMLKHDREAARQTVMSQSVGTADDIWAKSHANKQAVRAAQDDAPEYDER